MNQNNLLLIKEKLRLEKKRLHTILLKQNERTFRILDYLVLFMFLLNMATLFITNFLVVEQMPPEQIQLMEVNPAQAEINKFALHPNYVEIIWMILKQLFFWVLLVSSYFVIRTNIHTDRQLFIFEVGVILAFTLICFNFVNDFGYFAATII